MLCEHDSVELPASAEASAFRWNTNSAQFNPRHMHPIDHSFAKATLVDTDCISL